MKKVQRIFLVQRAAGAAPDMEHATFIASTSASDRYGDVVDQLSWKLDNYKSNPVIQVDHDYRADATVGRAASAEVKDGALVVDVHWGTDARSQDIAHKVMEGLLSAVSVGFVPGRGSRRSELAADHPYYADPTTNPYGMAYYDSELLEVSVVAVPANPEALAQRSAPGVDLDALATEVARRLIAAGALSVPAPTPAPKPNKETSLASWLAGDK
jgi:HK97 family phage prohead protease